MEFKKKIDQKDGIYSYVGKLNEYKEPSLREDDLMSKIIADIDSGEHWKEVVQRYLPDQGPPSFNQYKIVTFSTRGDYVNLFTQKDGGNISLDVGSGWGQSLDALSQISKEVWALEGTLERLEFIQRRAKQDNIEGLKLINASATDLPFEDGSFDTVTMVGVLEWIPVSDLGKDPREVQIDALREAFRVLRQGGELCVGIENSHGLKYLYGAPDDHTGIPHITHLDRESASKKLNAIRGENYRTYTYDMDGYMELLDDAGFETGSVDFYYPIPDYKIFSHIVSLDNLELLKFIYPDTKELFTGSDIENRVKEEELGMLEDENIDLLKRRVSSYFIVARK